MSSRLDLSEWIVHFIHDKHHESTRLDLDGNPQLTPVAYRPNGRSIFANFQSHREYEQHLEMSAFGVLLQIIDDGYLQTSWSERPRADGSFRPTIYGPRSAICFTEMPLHALLNYQNARAKSGYVGEYAIALKKSEFFAAGGRPVIYGLSGQHIEAETDDAFYNRSSRNLSAACGIALWEQYRYVAMSLSGNRLIDWSHEREWRWTKNYYSFDLVPGLEIWIDENDGRDTQPFSEIIVLTATEAEALEVVDRLKVSFDASRNSFGVSYNRRTLRKTNVISFERLKAERTQKIEDIHFSHLDSIRDVEVSTQMLKKADDAYENACREAKEKILQVKAYRDDASLGYCGWADLIIEDAHLPEVRALVNLGHAVPHGGEGYTIKWKKYASTGQSLDLAHYGATRAMEVLEEELGIKCYVKGVPD
ncbi:hypothetical protein [Pseudomonas protegens]